MVDHEHSTKQCRKCLQSFPARAEYFTTKGRSLDGLDTLCWSCGRTLWRSYKSRTKTARIPLPIPYPQRDLFQRVCECGCGEAVAGRFVHGHNSRVQNPMHNMATVRRFRLSRTIYTREQILAQRKLLREEAKRLVLAYYGNGVCACVRCGFADIRALSIDHIDGSGAKQRKALRNRGGYFYHWLRLHHFPDGYQTLCMNCQFIKRIENGECVAQPDPKSPVSTHGSN